MLIHESILECKQRIARTILRQGNFFDRVLIGMLAVFLLPSVPGLAQEAAEGCWPPAARMDYKHVNYVRPLFVCPGPSWRGQ